MAEGMTPGKAKPTILVVDDESFFRTLWADWLAQWGYRVVQTGSGGTVQDLIEGEDVFAVLTDIELPDVSGTEVLRRVKRLRPDVPVIVASCHRKFDVAREALREGALDYLVKPFSAEELRAAVRRAEEVHDGFLKNKAAKHSAARRLTDLILLREVSEFAGSQEALQPFLEKLLDAIAVSAEVEKASLMLVGEDGRLRVKAAKGLPATELDSIRTAPGEGIAGHVLASGEAVLVEDLSREKRFSPSDRPGQYQTNSLLSVPIRCKHSLIGVLNVNNKSSGEAFTAADRDLLVTIAHQTALAIENFKLVSHQQNQTRELEKAHRDLLRMYQARSRLVCNLSHELNTPLALIQGYLDYFLQTASPVGREERACLERAFEQCLRMEKLIAGMLRLFSIVSGEERWEWQPLSLSKLLCAALDAAADRIAERGLAQTVHLADNLFELFGDREKAAMLFAALVDNAVKFNRKGGRLCIEAENRPIDGLDYLYLRIHNDGRTVPAEAAEEIFEQYTQLGNIHTEKPGGVGIGLTLCRAILERMKGKIFLETSMCREGTSFGMLFPTETTYGVLTDDEK